MVILRRLAVVVASAPGPTVALPWATARLLAVLIVAGVAVMRRPALAGDRDCGPGPEKGERAEDHRKLSHRSNVAREAPAWASFKRFGTYFIHSSYG